MIQSTWLAVGAAAMFLSVISIGVRGTSYQKRGVLQIVASIASVYLWFVFAQNAFHVEHLVETQAEPFVASNPAIGYFGLLWGGFMVLDTLAAVFSLLRQR